MAILVEQCKGTLRRLQDYLGYYQNMSTVRNIGRKVKFATDGEERNAIRMSLQEHLAALNLFMNSVQMSAIGLIVEFLFRMIEGQSGEVSHTEALDFLQNPDRVNALLKDFSSETNATRSELDKNQEAVKQKLREAAEEKSGGDQDEGADGAASKDPTSSESQPGHSSSLSVPSVSVYNPLHFQWFADGGWRYLQVVSVDASPFLAPILPPAHIEYSRSDNYCCNLPEGWSITPTLIERDSKMEEGYF